MTVYRARLQMYIQRGIDKRIIIIITRVRVFTLFVVDVIYREYNYVNRMRKRGRLCDREGALLCSWTLHNASRTLFRRTEPAYMA